MAAGGDRMVTFLQLILFLHGNASVTLCDVSKDDDDTYGVSVKMYGRQDLAMQTVNLTVAGFDNLEAKNDNLTRDLDTQKIAEDQQEKTLLGNLTRLQKSFQDAVNGVEEKTQQDVQAAMDTLTDKLDTVTNNLSYHQAAQDQHGKFIGNLTHKLSDLEQTSTRHQKDNEEMKQRLTRVETVNEDQWKTAAGIQQNLTDIQDINQQLCSRQEALEEKFLTQQTVDTQLRQQLEDVEKEQEDLSSRHDLLADRVEDVHLALNDSTTQLADQLASGEAVLEEHLRAASLELNKTVDLVKRLQEKQNVLEATVEQLQRQDRGEAQTVKAMEDRITGLENLTAK
nr:hypothetical protein BaRGS_014333 [Batillaria attramentaria]